METRSKFLIGFLFFALISSSSNALISTQPATPKAISDLKEAIVKGLGFQSDEFKISGFDFKDALVGHSVAYEFDIEIDNKVLPFKLLEDVKSWEYVDLPIFRSEEEMNGLVKSDDSVLPVLAPFQLAGPMELWIQDAKDMRLSLPHDVDAGVLRKVILADGAVVTVTGARSVSLRHPLDLPLPLNRTNANFASGLLTLADHLRHASRNQNSPLLSLRVVGPTSLTSPSSSSSSSSFDNRLKLKRLAPGLVELSSPSKTKEINAISSIYDKDGVTLLGPNRFTTMWPLASIDGSNSNLRGFETLLTSVLGEKAYKEGSFKLVKADVSAQTYVKMEFEVEKELKEGDGFNWEGFPEWKTKPESVKMHFEVLAKVEGQKMVAEKLVQVNSLPAEESVAPNVIMGNTTMSRTSTVLPPHDPFTL
ncbi:hypothetical protein MKX01_011087 [Papaver californicum]|nr:hypothetical protein MKX01_011087 [Papaver californicum]